MPFSNPVVGRNVLIREAIESPDFVTGSAGWRIARDGSAEFNDVVVRGELDVTSGDGSYVRALLSAGHADLQLMPPHSSTQNFTPALLTAEIVSDPFGVDPPNPYLSISSPFEFDTTSPPAVINMFGPEITANDASQIDIIADTINLSTDGVGVGVTAGNTLVTIFGDLQVSGGGFTVTGGVGEVQWVSAAAQQSVNNSTVLVSDNELSVLVAANATYVVQLYVLFQTAVACDVKTAWSVPAASTGLKQCVGATSVAASFTSRSETQARVGGHGHATSIVYQLDAGGVDQLCWETGVVKTTAAGAITLQWAQNTATVGNLTRDGFSLMRVERIA